MNVAASFVACWTLFSPRSRSELKVDGIADDRCQSIDAKLNSGEPCKGVNTNFPTAHNRFIMTGTRFTMVYHGGSTESEQFAAFFNG